MLNPILALGAPGWPEIMMIMFFVLIFFGAKRLPDLAKSLGQSLQEFKKAKDDFHRELNRPTEEVVVAPAKDKEMAQKPS